MTPQSPCPTAIIFDWDNTLVDSWPAIMEAINLTRAEFGQPVWDIDGIKTNCTRAARDSFPEWFGDRWQDAYDFYYRGFDDIRKKREIQLLNGAAALLDWLDGQNIPAFIVSNKRGDYLRIEIAKLGWERRFKGVAGAGDAAKDKPAVEHVLAALQNSGIVPGPHVWFVGDSETDIRCARNAGCTPVLTGDANLAERLQVPLAFADCAGLLACLTGLAPQPN